jgi:hypothetical protein
MDRILTELHVHVYILWINPGIYVWGNWTQCNKDFYRPWKFFLSSFSENLTLFQYCTLQHGYFFRDSHSLLTKRKLAAHTEDCNFDKKYLQSLFCPLFSLGNRIHCHVHICLHIDISFLMSIVMFLRFPFIMAFKLLPLKIRMLASFIVMTIVLDHYHKKCWKWNGEELNRNPRV